MPQRRKHVSLLLLTTASIVILVVATLFPQGGRAELEESTDSTTTLLPQRVPTEDGGYMCATPSTYRFSPTGSPSSCAQFTTSNPARRKQTERTLSSPLSFPVSCLVCLCCHPSSFLLFDVIVETKNLIICLTRYLEYSLWRPTLFNRRHVFGTGRRCNCADVSIEPTNLVPRRTVQVDMDFSGIRNSLASYSDRV